MGLWSSLSLPLSLLASSCDLRWCKFLKAKVVPPPETVNVAYKGRRDRSEIGSLCGNFGDFLRANLVMKERYVCGSVYIYIYIKWDPDAMTAETMTGCNANYANPHTVIRAVSCVLLLPTQDLLILSANLNPKPLIIKP